MKNLGQIMKQVQDMQTRMAEMQEKLQQVEYSGAAGGGLVQATVNGKGELKRMKIDPSLLVPAEAEVLEDLVLAAVNDGKAKADAGMQAEMGKLTGGLPLPPGFKLPF
jgi:DNA-binding YbaB/EbfC family protein